MDEKKLFDSLDKITKLLAMFIVKEKSLKDQVKILSDLGLKPSEIAVITGKTANLIRVTKTSLKNKNG